jgi:hypothetical protein
MIGKLFVCALVTLGLLTAGASEAWAQQRNPTPVTIPANFRYSVKFVCGQAQEPAPCLEYREGGSEEVKWICPDSTVPAGANGAQVVRGLYATAINVYNPTLPKGTNDGSVVFGKKVAVALPWQKSGPVSHFERAVLRSGHAFEIDCEELAAKVLETFPGGTGTPPPFPVFLKGFLVIMSPAELDVTAVYSSRPLTSGISTIDVEVIEPRKQYGFIEADIPSETAPD